jgi:hypothetical protein
MLAAWKLTVSKPPVFRALVLSAERKRIPQIVENSSKRMEVWETLDRVSELVRQAL